MRQWLLFLVLVTAAFGSCRKDTAIGPSDLLYQRWHLFQTWDVNSSDWTAQNSGAYYDIAYRQDGTVIYYKDGVVSPTPCCSGSRFERNGVQIQYSEYLACPTVYCAPGTATITQLKEDLLELQNGNTIRQYKPVK